MTTQYSPILKLALPVQGELSGTWGDVVNDNITSMVEQAIAGRAVIDTWTTNSHTLTSANGTTSESRCAMLELTDTGTALSGAGTVVCPTASKIYIVKNAAGQNITVKTSGGTGILVPDGRTTFLFCDGTNVVEALTHTTSLQLGTSTTVTAVLDEDNMASDSATSLATQQSIKAYVDAQVGANNELSEVLANGNTSGANDIIVDNGQKITTNTIDETTADSGVTIDSVLLKDDGVNATNLEVTNIKANDGTAAGSIADSTGVVTVASAVLTTADINGGTADGVVIGGTTPAAATATTVTANTSLNIASTVTVTSILDEDNMASDDPAGLATQQSIKAYVDSQVTAQDLDFGGDSGTGAVDLDSQTFTIAGTANEIETSASGQTLTVGLPDNVTIAGDLTVDTDTLYVDSTNDRVGINTSSPTYAFHGKSTSSAVGIVESTGASSDFYFKDSGTTHNYSNGIGSVGDDLRFKSGDGSEAMRIDSSQRVLIANDTSQNIATSSGAGLQISSTGALAAASISRFKDADSGPWLFFGKSRGATVGTNVVVSSGDSLGALRFGGDDGTDIESYGAEIKANVDGTPGSNDMPGRLSFWTTVEGASSSTERMRIDDRGVIMVGVQSTTLPTPGIDLLSSGIISIQDSGGASRNVLSFSGGVVQHGAAGGGVTAQTFSTNNVVAMTIDSSRRVLIGVEPARGTVFGASTYYPQFQLEGTGSEESSGLIVRNQNGTGGPYLVLGKTRATATRGVTIVSDGDTVGRVSFQGADGINLEEAAYVQAQIDGTPGANDMPGRLGLFTTADGSANPTERLRISSDGHMGFGTPTTDDVFYTFTKGGTDYSGDFATYNMGQMDSFRFYQSATTKWAKVFARSYQTPNQFGTQNAILEVMGNGSTGGNGHFVTLHVTTKQQQGSDGYDIYATGNNGYNVAYKFDATGGYESAGLLEIWVQPQENYLTTCLWVKTSQRRGDPTSEPVAWFGLEDTGSATQPTGSTVVQQHNPFMGLHYKDGATNGTYETSESYQAWYPRLNINRYLDLGGNGTTKPTIASSDNQIMQISGTSNRATMNIFQTQSGSDGPKFRFAKGRSNTINGIGTKAENGDQNGIIINYTDDGTDVSSYSSYINFKVDGATGTNDTPGRIEFATTSDGAAASTERMRITSAGIVEMYGNSSKTLHLKSTSPILAFTDTNSFPDANDHFQIRGTSSDGIAAGSMGFYDSSADTTSTYFTIRDDGKIGIRNTTPTAIGLQVGGDPSGTVAPSMSISLPDEGGTNTSLAIRGGSPTIFFDQTGGGNGKFLMDSADIAFKSGSMQSEGSERVRIRWDGGITFNGDTAAANALDDYEEGTWTPVYSTSGGGQSVTYNNQIGIYTKIGNLVTIHFNLDITSATNIGSGDIVITGLPFPSGSTSSSSNYNRSTFSTYGVDYDSTDGTQMHMYIPTSNVSKLQILYSQDNAAWVVGTTSNFNIGTGRTIIVMGSLSYYTDS